MVWEAAYAELYFTEAFWPDFNREALEHALKVYRSRERRFGGLSPDAGIKGAGDTRCSLSSQIATHLAGSPR